MCMESVSKLIMSDPEMQERMANPMLEAIHKQVLMNLYALQADRRLHFYGTLMPLYLGSDKDRLDAILEDLQTAGLLRKNGKNIELVYQVETEAGSSCGCH
jgi:hypothetical protein